MFEIVSTYVDSLYWKEEVEKRTTLFLNKQVMILQQLYFLCNPSQLLYNYIKVNIDKHLISKSDFTNISSLLHSPILLGSFIDSLCWLQGMSKLTLMVAPVPFAVFVFLTELQNFKSRCDLKWPACLNNSFYSFKILIQKMK